MIHEKLIPLLTESEKKTYYTNISTINKFEKTLKDLKKIQKIHGDRWWDSKKYDEISQNIEKIKEEFRKKHEDNKFILMLLDIEIDENGNTQLHKNIGRVNDYEKTIQNFNDGRLLNLPNNFGQMPLHLACDSPFATGINLLYYTPYVKIDAVDNDGNNIFHYCFKTKYFNKLICGGHERAVAMNSARFTHSVLQLAASNLKLFMTPNFKGEFCLTNSKTDFVNEISSKKGQILYQLLFQLNKNLTEGLPEQENYKIIKDIEKQLSSIKLSKYDHAQSRYLQKKLEAIQKSSPQNDNVKKKSVDEAANQYSGNELDEQLPDFVAGLNQIISDKLNNITADNNQELYIYISSSDFTSLKEKLINKIINNFIIALDEKITYEDQLLSLNFVSIDKRLQDFLSKTENFIQIFQKNLNEQKFMCLKNLVDWALIEGSNRQQLVQKVVEQILFKEIENTADLSADMLLGFNVIDKDSWKSNNDVENIGEYVENTLF